ncbi:MAG: transposase [Candidatus Omnitrophota bacterium]
MPTGPRLLLENACYHVYARGNNKRRIFNNHNDYKKYLFLLKRYKKKYKFEVFGYCLMPNHIHLLLDPVYSEDLSKIMSCLQRSYTAYFNGKNKWVGHLWQGRFKSRVVNKDRYLIDCITYIELNPVRAKMVSAPHDYPWSSYLGRTQGKEDEVLDEIHFA